MPEQMPMPGRKSHRYRFYRHACVMREARANIDHEDLVRPRRRRIVTRLTIWDEISRSDWRHRTWKRHRRTQYIPLDFQAARS